MLLLLLLLLLYIYIYIYIYIGMHIYIYICMHTDMRFFSQFGGLMAVSEFSAGTADEARFACTDRSVLRVQLGNIGAIGFC